MHAKRCFADDPVQSSKSRRSAIWWSQTGSNRRPHACKARALPAELWPRNQKTNASRPASFKRGSATRSRRRSVVGLGRLELPTSRLSSARSNQLSYKPVTLFRTKDAPVMRPRRPSSKHALKPTTTARPRKTFWACVFVREERETKTAKSRQWNSPRSGDRDGPCMFL
jgi:hypothetical protein